MQHHGRRVIRLNYSGFKSDLATLRAEVEMADQEVCRQPYGSVLALADLSDTTASAAAVELFKQSATRTKPHIDRLAQNQTPSTGSLANRPMGAFPSACNPALSAPLLRPHHSLLLTHGRDPLVLELLDPFSFVRLGRIDVALGIRRDAVHREPHPGLTPTVAELRQNFQ